MDEDLQTKLAKYWLCYEVDANKMFYKFYWSEYPLKVARTVIFAHSSLATYSTMKTGLPLLLLMTGTVDRRPVLTKEFQRQKQAGQTRRRRTLIGLK